MPLLISPAPGSVPTSDLHKLVIDHLKISADPNNTPYDRFMALENATRLARQYQEAGGKNSLPVEVTDPAYVRSQLLAYGQMTLATAAHAINGRLGDTSSQSLHLRSAQTVIGLMARAGLQSEEQSYGVFGGRSVFDQRLAQLEAPKSSEKLYAAAITTDPDALSNLYLEGLRKLGLSDTEMAARMNVFQGALTATQSSAGRTDASTPTPGMVGDYAAMCAAFTPVQACPAAPPIERTVKPAADLSLTPP